MSEECITTIKGGCLYIPKKCLQIAGLREGSKVILRANSNGLMFRKADFFNEIDEFFSKLDEGLQSLYVKQKAKDFSHKPKSPL